MLFPLSKGFSSSSIFQKGGAHHERPIKRVWTVDHTGSAERTKELHHLLKRTKPYVSYKQHEMLATSRAEEGKKQDAARMSAWRRDLGEIYDNIDAQANDRRDETHNRIVALRSRNKASRDNLKQTLKQQRKDHKDFLDDMQQRVNDMPYIWGGEPIRETVERRQARKDAYFGVKQQTKDYQKEIGDLKDALDNRGPQEWTAMPRVSSDTIIMRRKAQGIKMLTQTQREWEAALVDMEDKHHQLAEDERNKLRMRNHSAKQLIGANNQKFLEGIADTHAKKKAELSDIKARVDGRGNGKPLEFDGRPNAAFTGYATAGYTPVEKSSKRQRDHAAIRADPDANHEETDCKTLCLNMPMNVRNRVIAAHNPRLSSSLTGTGIDTPQEWAEMSWTNRWALLSRHAPSGAVQKAQQKSGMAQDSFASSGPVEQRTLSPRTLGLAAATS